MAKNSPDGAKSIERGTFWNLIQSMSVPEIRSQTLMQPSIELASNHFELGCEKHKSVILLSAALSKNLTLFSPVLAFKSVILKFVVEMATKSFTLL